jgi:ABC-type transport system substrate-binding protein
VLLSSLLAVLLLATAACGDDEGGDGDDASGASTTTTPDDEGDPQPGGKVVYGLIAETNNWDPTAGQWGSWSLIVANSIFDTLSRYNADGAIEPYLAEGFYPNPDFSQWRIKLREGVTFSNGEALTADVLADNLQFHRDSPLTGGVFQHVTELDVVDERNLRVVMDRPFVQFPGIFATQVGVVMAPEMLANEDRGREPIGTGPFKIDEWVPDTRMVVVRNENYWQTDDEGNPLPYLEEIEFRPIPDDESRVNALLSGEVDIMQTTVPQDVASLREDDEFNVLGDLSAEDTDYMAMLNTAVPPFDDPVARQALAYATDREEYNEILNDGLAAIAESPFREESRWYHDVDYPEFDPDRARELVEQYEAEHGPLTFTLTSNPSVRSVTGAQTLQEQWAQVGIDVTLDTKETASLISAVAFGDYQSVLWTQFGSAHPFLEEPWWKCEYVEPMPTVGLNFARHCDEEIDEQMLGAAQDSAGVSLNDDGAAIVTSDALKPYYDRVQELLAADLPYIFIYHQETTVVARKTIHDVLEFQMPSGSQGLAFNQGAHPVLQMWYGE